MFKRKIYKALLIKKTLTNTKHPTNAQWNFLIEIDFTCFFLLPFSMVSLYRNQFINLPYILINWLLYDEIVDSCEAYSILTIEKLYIQSPQLRHDFQYTVRS